MMKKFFGCLKIFVSAALLAALIWIMKDKLSAIAAIIAGASKLLYLVSLVLIAIGMVMQSYRLKFMLDAQGIHLKIKDVTFLTFMGQFFNNFMPTAVGGDVIKAYYVSTTTKKKLETFASVATDRMLGVITLMWITLAAVSVSYKQMPNKAIVFIIAVVIVFGAVFMGLIFSKKMARIFLFVKKLFKNAKFKDQMQRLYEATNQYRNHKILVFHALWLSLAAQLIFFFMIYLLAISISSNVPFMFFLLTLPVISTVSMLPSLNGLGIREGGFVYFLGGAMGRENAFALSLLYLSTIIAVSIAGGLIFLFKKEFKQIESLIHGE